MERDLDNESAAVAYRAIRLHSWLKPLLEPSAAATKAYAFKNRTKSAGEIMSKVNAKRSDPDDKRRKPKYRATDVTDASGFRIVCLFNTEIPIALGHLFDLIAAPVDAESRGSFADPPITEVIYYSSRAKSEPLSIYPDVERVVREKGYASRFKAPEAAGGERSSSYSSVHVIVRGRIDDGGSTFEAHSEIQVRSVFEEAWGEINHKLKYGPAKRERALGAESATRTETLEDRHLDALKSLTDGCAQYADLINLQLMERQAGQAKRNPKSIEPREKLLAPFRACTPVVYEQIVRAYELEHAAERLPSDDTMKPQRFLEAGLRFVDAIAALEGAELPTDAAERARLVRLLREEVGYCYMFSGNSDLVTKAENLFEELLLSDPDNPIVLIRLAQIKRDASALEKARALMERALAVIESQDGAGDERLAWLLFRDLAFICWQLVDQDRGREDAVTLLRRAVDLSQRAIEAAPGPKHRLSAQTNLLYYYVDLVDQDEPTETLAIEARAKDLLAEVTPTGDPRVWNIDDLDTIVRAEYRFRDRREARRLAAVLVDRIRSTMRSKDSDRREGARDAFLRLSAAQQEMLLDAQDVLNETERDPKPGG